MANALTDRTLKALKPAPAGKRYEKRDGLVPGLLVRVTETGKRTFMLQTRYPGFTQPTRRELGVYDALSLDKARQRARDWLELIRKGIDPARQAELRQQANTFAAVAEDYLRFQVIGPDPDKPRQRKAAEVSRAFRRVFFALWDERPITSISRHDVLTLIEGVRDQGTAGTLAALERGPAADKTRAPGQARNLLGLLKTFFSWAIERGTYGLESSPCEHLKGARIIGERQSDDRTLNDVELLAFWQATGQMEYPYQPIYRLLLLTGLRLNEVADAVWSEFDQAKAIWTIPASRMKGKNGKARPHAVPLTPDIRAILDSLPRFNRGQYLFSTNIGESPVWISHKVKRRLDAAMLGVLQEQARKRGEAVNKVKLPAWVNHDLRRTLRSHLSELRVSSDVAEAILAHVKPGIRGVYDPYEYFDEKRDALELWAAHIKTLTGSKSVSAKAAPREEVGNDKPRASFAERSAWLARTRQ
ncbi:MAG: integrase arm-type DNA-binding domain-containing protein [Pseudolabrys sp.]